MADDLEAPLVCGGSLSDLFEPGAVRSPHLCIGVELRRAGLEQELDGKPVALEPVVDQLSERFHGRLGTVKLVVGKIDAVENTQLVAAWRLQRALINVECVPISPRAQHQMPRAWAAVAAQRPA